MGAYLPFNGPGEPETRDDGAGYHDGLGCCGADMEPAHRSRQRSATRWSCERCGGTLMSKWSRCECGWRRQP
jgi:hypothetical protein